MEDFPFQYLSSLNHILFFCELSYPLLVFELAALSIHFVIRSAE